MRVTRPNAEKQTANAETENLPETEQKTLAEMVEVSRENTGKEELVGFDVDTPELIVEDSLKS